MRDQVETYERSGGREANTLRDTGLPIIIVTTRGNKSGKLRKTPLMRVEHDGEYALVASHGRRAASTRSGTTTSRPTRRGGDPGRAGAVRRGVREVTGDERAEWWERAVAAYPPYAEYQTKTERKIPVFVARRRG